MMRQVHRLRLAQFFVGLAFFDRLIGTSARAG